MKKRVMFSSCAAAVLSMSVAAAQTTTQTPTQSPVQGSTQGTSGQSRPTTGVTNATSITVTGCVMRESDYTKARGGALGTGVGAGNEFVLANAMTGAATRSAIDQPSRGEVAPGVAGSTSSGRESAPTGTSGGVSAGAGATDQAGSRPGATAGIDAGVSTNAGRTDAPAATSGADSTAGRSAADNSRQSPTATTGAATTGMAYMLTGSREGDLAAHVGKRVEIVGTMEGATATGTSGQARSGAAEMREIDITSFRVVPGNCQ